MTDHNPAAPDRTEKPLPRTTFKLMEAGREIASISPEGKISIAPDASQIELGIALNYALRELWNRRSSLESPALDPTAELEPKCDCGDKLTQCSGCAVAEWQALHTDCRECCPRSSEAISGPPEGRTDATDSTEKCTPLAEVRQVKRAIWRVISTPVAKDIADFILLHSRFDIPAEQNYSRFYFDPSEEEIYKECCSKGVVSWKKTNPWLDIETVISS